MDKRNEKFWLGGFHIFHLMEYYNETFFIIICYDHGEPLIKVWNRKYIDKKVFDDQIFDDLD